MICTHYQKRLVPFLSPDELLSTGYHQPAFGSFN